MAIQYDTTPYTTVIDYRSEEVYEPETEPQHDASEKEEAHRILSQGDGDDWDWSRDPIVNQDLEDPTAPWYEQGNSNINNTVIPVPIWFGLQMGLLCAIAAAIMLSTPEWLGHGKATLPPELLRTPPNFLPVLPEHTTENHGIPCAQDPVCAVVMTALDPAMAMSTRSKINLPGTCQHWAREWLRMNMDVMKFDEHRLRQRFAMSVMYCEFDGDNWLQQDLWLSDIHECDWNSFNHIDPCGKTEQYQILRNYNQQLRGTFPPELAMLTNLWEISFSDNLLEGSIPSELEQLAKLDTLVLSFNLFKGEVPEFIWNFEDMVYLDLGHNFFESTLPENLPLTMLSLRVLSLENNYITGSLPKDFGRVDWKRLHLDGNRLTGSIPEDIFQDKTRFEELLLHNNFFQSEIPTKGLGDMNKMLEVTFYGNPELSGDINDICQNFDPAIGLLQTAQVDKDSVACECCDGSLNQEFESSSYHRKKVVQAVQTKLRAGLG